jgi:predicted AlkP superfamily phosphohydrolase/phosphomutase
VNGVMISGFDFPGEGPGSHIDARAVYPRSAHAELRRAVGPYPIDPPILKEMEQGRYDVALERILETIRQQAAHAKYLMQSRPWDCFMMVFGETDGVSHYFWQFFDRRSPFFTQQPPGLEDAILRVYQEVDRQTGELFALAPEGTLRMIVSDHGSGGISDWVLFPNRWLEGKGYCRLRTGAARGLSRLRERFKQWGVATIPSWLQRLLYRNAIGMLGRYEARVRYGILDWSGTQAYFDENPYYPVLRINLAGRQPQGIVAAQDYEPLRDRLIQDLESWRHPVTGAPLVEKAFRREEVYSGECLAEAADIVPKWALDDGQNYNFRISSKSPGPQWIARIDPQRRDGPYYPRKFSSHRDYAIFAAQGDAIAARGLTHGARIIDLAPTILNLFDVAVPTEMDGRALNDIFKGVSEALAVANGFPASAAPKERAIGTAGRDGPNLGRPLQSTSPVEPRR